MKYKISFFPGLNDQLSQLSESLAQNSQEKSDLQAMVDQLLVEKQSLETSAQNKEELIKLNAENSSRMSSLEARIGRIHDLFCNSRNFSYQNNKLICQIFREIAQVRSNILFKINKNSLYTGSSITPNNYFFCFLPYRNGSN